MSQITYDKYNPFGVDKSVYDADIGDEFLVTQNILDMKMGEVWKLIDIDYKWLCEVSHEYSVRYYVECGNKKTNFSLPCAVASCLTLHKKSEKNKGRTFKRYKQYKIDIDKVKNMDDVKLVFKHVGLSITPKDEKTYEELKYLIKNKE